MNIKVNQVSTFPQGIFGCSIFIKLQITVKMQQEILLSGFCHRLSFEYQNENMTLCQKRKNQKWFEYLNSLNFSLSFIAMNYVSQLVASLGCFLIQHFVSGQLNIFCKFQLHICTFILSFYFQKPRFLQRFQCLFASCNVCCISTICLYSDAFLSDSIVCIL